jgi:hypothetical protein
MTKKHFIVKEYYSVLFLFDTFSIDAATSPTKKYISLPVFASAARQSRNNEAVIASVARQSSNNEPVIASVARQSSNNEPVIASAARQSSNNELSLRN